MFRQRVFVDLLALLFKEQPQQRPMFFGQILLYLE
jgi:hypothetical protein